MPRCQKPSPNTKVLGFLKSSKSHLSLNVDGPTAMLKKLSRNSFVGTAGGAGCPGGFGWARATPGTTKSENATTLTNRRMSLSFANVLHDARNESTGIERSYANTFSAVVAV